MSDKEQKNGDANPFEELAQQMGRFSADWQKATGDWMSAWTDGFQTAMETATGGANGAAPQSGNGAKSGGGRAAAFAGGPAEQILAQQAELMNDYQTLWMRTTARLLNSEAEAVIAPEKGDYRFADPEWTENPVFDFIKQSYLLNARWFQNMLSNIEGLDPDTAKKVEFYSRQIVDAMSPSNFALTNPMVLREMKESGGASLVRGFTNMVEDLKSGQGGLRPRHTDPDAFEVGVDIATAPGSVVYQTPLMQLIQYKPATADVLKRPLLIYPPWINKFYILDLSPENSFIRWAVDQGHTVFVVSWVNPDESMRDLSFDDYYRDGILAALDGVEQATGERQVNAIGYCIGGTLLAAALAYMAATGDDRIASATFFAAQVDFEEAGDLRLFSDAQQVAMIEHQVLEKGYLDAASMAATFNMLRANDLIWYFVINNYLMGKAPPKFDLLYWNGDSTRFPARLLLQYLKNMYQENALVKPGGFEILGRPVDLRDVKIPVYINATREDHIAPAKSVFKAMQLYSGPKRFLLSGSGHIAGVINPPAKNKYQFWSNGKRKKYQSLEDWLADATETPGSWWPDWQTWIEKLSDAKVPAREPGDGKLDVIEAAPGSYVKVRS